MNLLLIKKDEKKHYVPMKDFNKFMCNQSKHKERKHFCMYCLQCFKSESILKKHVDNCLTINGKQAINMPKKDENILKFNNFHKQESVPFVTNATKVQGCKPNDDKSYTKTYQTHEDCGYGCCYKYKYSKPIQKYRGENAVYKFMERCLKRLNTVKV